MSDKVELGEIVYCDLTITHKGKDYQLKEVVYKNSGPMFYKKRYLGKLKIEEPVKVKTVKVISRLGFESKSIGFTEVKASEEKRNKITGAYE